MAKCQVKLPDELIRKISRLGSRTDEVVGKALTAGAKATLPYVQRSLHDSIGSNLRSHNGKSRSTGELEKALGVSPVRIDSEGNANVKIGFSEPRSGGGSNSMLASVLENGKHGQPPKPFLKPAIKASRNACKAAVISTLEKEMEKL